MGLEFNWCIIMSYSTNSDVHTLFVGLFRMIAARSTGLHIQMSCKYMLIACLIYLIDLIWINAFISVGFVESLWCSFCKGEFVWVFFKLIVWFWNLCVFGGFSIQKAVFSSFLIQKSLFSDFYFKISTFRIFTGFKHYYFWQKEKLRI
jgi:hypothetical protein